ncbi:LuxR family transcriptional regulator [Haloactinopolyspora sp.]|uniref:helix-turn-helix transcriptional regulator n=1 Tax=Haloactinopolyspora sp. TaxID=1966353 RepID=UPI0026044DDD|nr:LuxR family transcriptional regulator [Haloactinopolyspora sp.]
MLQELGISEFEEQVYRRLLGEPEMTVPALAAALSTSPRRVRAATSRLCTLGLATRTEAGGYAPVSPDAAIDALIHQREAELDRVRAAKRELLDEFRTGHLKRQPSGLLEVVSGREAIHRRSVEARLGARYEVLSFDQPPYAAPEDYDEVANEHPVLARGVTYHVIYTPESLQLPGRVRAITELGRAGEQARLLPSLPIKLHIYDRSLALVPLISDRHATESIVLIRESGLLDGLIALFEAHWRIAHPVTEAPRESPLTDADRDVLAMLSAGLTDQAMARQLQVSVRTVRRRIHRVLDLLDAATRYQAGVAAARRDWA